MITAFTLPYSGKDLELIGVQVIYSLPWLRVRPRWIRSLYERTSFVPSIGSTTIGGTPVVIDPPVTVTNEDGGYDCTLVGNWIKREASAGGFLCGAGMITDGDPLVVGELYRYIGNNYGDPFPGGGTTGLGAMLNPYWDKFYQGRLSPANQQTRNASRSGIVTSGTKYSLTQADHNWWADWANSGTLRTESGTITTGGMISITDSTKDTTNPLLPHSCWWKNDSARYTGTTTAYEGFILEVTHAGTVYKLPITSTSNGAGGVVVNFASIGVTFAAGDTYLIREPKYELNKWKGRTLTVKAADGTPILTNEPILYSDASTLYFAPKSQPIPADATFEIIEKQPGVYRWTGTEFVLASGADAARVTVQTAVDFLPDPNANNNGWVTDYGVIEYGDLLHVEVLNQLYRAMKLLYDTQTGLSFTNKASPTAEPERNSRSSAAQLPLWTTSPTVFAYYGENAFCPPYDNFPDAWERQWKATYAKPTEDCFRVYSEAQYGDYLAGGDGNVEFDGKSPRQTGRYENIYFYFNSWDVGVTGQVTPGCAYAAWSDAASVGYNGVQVDSAFAYGKVSPLAGFKKLSAQILGNVYAGISPDNPDETDPETLVIPNYCNGRHTEVINKFGDNGSGVLYRKWHSYASWSAAAGTVTPVIGPKLGTVEFVEQPDLQLRKCETQTCTFPGYPVYTASQESWDVGVTGWCVVDQFARVKWDMEGF